MTAPEGEPERARPSPPRCARCGAFAFDHPYGVDSPSDPTGLEWRLICPAFVPHDLTEKQKEDRRQFYKEIGV